MTLVIGKEFNEIFKNKILIKLTNEAENHNGFQFQTGLNIDTVKFNPKGNCRPGGIYFCTIESLGKWLRYNDKIMCFVRFVTIPNDSQVYISEAKIKADKIILSERKKINELENWNDTKFALATVDQMGSSLKYIKNQTLEMCVKAVTKYAGALEYVNSQNFTSPEIYEICLAAVRSNVIALQYAKNHNIDMAKLYLDAAKKDGFALYYMSVEARTREICMVAVKSNPAALLYVPKQTRELCLEAVKNNANAIHYMEQQEWNSGACMTQSEINEICMFAVKSCGSVLLYVEIQTKEICLEACKQDIEALKYVNENFKPYVISKLKSLKLITSRSGF
jgi:hypothetical protein